ncbi:MAG: hypothetical protein WCG01_03995 [bacterium]
MKKTKTNVLKQKQTSRGMKLQRQTKTQIEKNIKRLSFLAKTLEPELRQNSPVQIAGYDKLQKS